MASASGEVAGYRWRVVEHGVLVGFPNGRVHLLPWVVVERIVGQRAAS